MDAPKEETAACLGAFFCFRRTNLGLSKPRAPLPLMRTVTFRIATTQTPAAAVKGSAAAGAVSKTRSRMIDRAEASAKHNVESIQIRSAGWICRYFRRCEKRLFFGNPRTLSFGAVKRKRVLTQLPSPASAGFLSASVTVRQRKAFPNPHFASSQSPLSSGVFQTPSARSFYGYCVG